jgi:hypothetical protein
MKISRWIFGRMKNVSDESCRENLNTHFIFLKIVPLEDDVEKYCEQIPDDNMAHALCMLDNAG